MYAVIRSGGKQYRVTPGDKVKVERRDGKVGAEVVFEKGDVLAVGTDEKKLVSGKGVAGARVTGTIVKQGRHPKVLVMKFKKTNQYKICRGHRQDYTAVEIGEITV
jgi:large subunit ribosomal protein L21